MSPGPDAVERAREAVEAVALDLIGDSAEVAARVTDLRPPREVLTQIVLPAAVEPLSVHLDRMLRPGVTPGVPASHVGCTSVTCLAGLLGEDNAWSRRFPGGYRRVAPWLLPLVPWSCVRLHPPGQEGEAIVLDGLVWVDERVWWLPKPYRALPRAPERS